MRKRRISQTPGIPKLPGIAASSGPLHTSKVLTPSEPFQTEAATPINMNADSGAISAGRLLIRAVTFASGSIGAQTREFAQTLKSISTYLAEIAEALRLGNSPLKLFALLRAKTITFIIVAREVVPEQTAREIALHLVSSTRVANQSNAVVAAACDFETASNLFKSVSELFTQ